MPATGISAKNERANTISPAGTRSATSFTQTDISVKTKVEIIFSAMPRHCAEDYLHLRLHADVGLRETRRGSGTGRRDRICALVLRADSGRRHAALAGSALS